MELMFGCLDTLSKT